MTCKDIIDTILSREGLFRNVANPFASTELLIQENIRILNELIDDIVLRNSLSDLLRECVFYTYNKFVSGHAVAADQVIYSGRYRYKTNLDSVPTVDPATLEINPGESAATSDGITWQCLGDWNQYPFSYLAQDCAGIDTGTVMNMTNRTEMQALNMHQWMKLKASSISVGTTGLFTVRDKSIYIFPGIADGTEIQFLYYTTHPVISKTGERKKKFTDVADTTIIPEQILTLGTAYRYLKDKDIGNWNEIESEYRQTMNDYEAAGQAPQQISLAGNAPRAVSNYSDGNWNV